MQNLTDDEKLLYKTFKEATPDLDDLAFAQVLLRGSARNFNEAREAFDNERISRKDFLEADRELRRHAVLYTRESIRAGIEEDAIDGRDSWDDMFAACLEVHNNPDEIDPKLGSKVQA